MYIQTSLRCRRSSSIFLGFDQLSEPELARAQVANGQRRLSRTAVTQGSSLGNRFLRNVEVSPSTLWGSAAERRHFRQEVFSYQARFVNKGICDTYAKFEQIFCIRLIFWEW